MTRRIAIWPTDPALRMRLARRLMSHLLCIDEERLRNVESSLDAEGTLTVVGDVTVDGVLDAVECDVKIDWGKP